MIDFASKITTCETWKSFSVILNDVQVISWSMKDTKAVTYWKISCICSKMLRLTFEWCLRQDVERLNDKNKIIYEERREIKLRAQTLEFWIHYDESIHEKSAIHITFYKVFNWMNCSWVLKILRDFEMKHTFVLCLEMSLMRRWQQFTLTRNCTDVNFADTKDKKFEDKV